jgi:hypothetical protein
MYGYNYNRIYCIAKRTAATLILPVLIPLMVHAQQSVGETETERRFAEMTALIQKLQARVDDLEGKLQSADKADKNVTAAVVSNQAAEAIAEKPPASTTTTPADTPGRPDLLRGTSVNILLDAYYGYNFNNPIGRVNLLRAYDVSSNSFSLNQADVVLENAADPDHGKRFGMRLDLQFGQATETLQGNAANELRPNVWRNIFQAYGTYVAPVGNGLTVDFGKWASSLGIEGNYTKDQMNYSRSYWFNFLPFYHTGARLNYKFSDAVAVNYWITNGTQQTEPFNNFKDQLFGLNLQPRKNVAWTVNYYFGQEHPDIQFVPEATGSGLPTQQGIPFEPIPNAPKGKLHIFDTYLTWQASQRLTFGIEGDYVIQRLTTTSAPAHTAGGAGYARYQLTPRTAIAARAEYLSDRGGLFTGNTQAIKDTTLTFEQRLAEGFLLRQEWRRDSSNQPYFLTDTLGVLKKEQNTLTLGVVWWFGAKEGGW